MGMRIVMRWFALGAPYQWFGFATRFKDNDESVGVDFFREFASRVHATFEGDADAGLMQSFYDLRSDDFDPARVHGLIREFYEQTSKFDMQIRIRWNPLVRPLGALYKWLIARRMKQLVIPLDNETLSGLDSWLDLIDLERDGKADYRVWVRVLKDSRVPVYIGAYKTYRSILYDRNTTYVSVAFPIPGGSLTTVLAPRNLDSDGLLLTTRLRSSNEAGVYIVLPHRQSFSMAPAFGLSEQFKLNPSNDEQGSPIIVVEHTCYWLGIRAFVMNYTIDKKRTREPRCIENLCLAAGIAPTQDSVDEKLGNLRDR